MDGALEEKKKKTAAKRKKLGINAVLLKNQRLHMAVFCQQDKAALLILMNLCRLPLSESSFHGEFLLESPDGATENKRPETWV